MSNSVQKLNIKGTVSKLLSTIPPKNREVLERRFGLAQRSPETLESIGKSYKITRERVRQIQEYGLKKIMQGSKAELLEPLFDSIKSYVNSRGGVAKETGIFTDLVRAQDIPLVSLVLKLIPDIIFSKKSEDLHTRYAFDNNILKEADSLVLKTHDILGGRNSTIAFDELVLLIAEESRKLNYTFTGSDTIANVMGLSRKLKKGPFGSYGLADWSVISPRGVRDKAHLVFEQEKRPLHFREITSFIDKYFSTSTIRKTHAQTVHNELIKDPRFVLIGRGLYALAEWGYEPGTVKDVLLQILKEHNRPLSKDELFEVIAERRFVKPNTVFLNLQNKHYFKKVDGGKYYIA